MWVEVSYQSSSAAVTLDCKPLSTILRSMIGMSGLALANDDKSEPRG